MKRKNKNSAKNSDFTLWYCIAHRNKCSRLINREIKKPDSQRDEEYLHELLITSEFYEDKISKLCADKRAFGAYRARRVLTTVCSLTLCVILVVCTARAGAEFGNAEFSIFRGIDMLLMGIYDPEEYELYKNWFRLSDEQPEYTSQEAHAFSESGEIIQESFDSPKEAYEYLSGTDYDNILPTFPDEVCGMKGINAEIIIAEPDIVDFDADYSNGKESFSCSAFYNKYSEGFSKSFGSTAKVEETELLGEPCVYVKSEDKHIIYFAWGDCYISVTTKISREKLMEIATVLMNVRY